MQSKYIIYAIVALVLLQAYVGSTIDSERRWKRVHLPRLRKNKHENKVLQAAFNEHGEEYFDFIPQAAWSERWKSMSGVDPPRGFAFAWFKIKGSDVGVYSLHLKSNLVTTGNKEKEEAKNIRKREVAAGQLLDHMRDVIAKAMPMIGSVIIGGDFNTNRDQPMFAS